MAIKIVNIVSNFTRASFLMDLSYSSDLSSSIRRHNFDLDHDTVFVVPSSKDNYKHKLLYVFYWLFFLFIYKIRQLNSSAIFLVDNDVSNSSKELFY